VAGKKSNLASANQEGLGHQDFPWRGQIQGGRKQGESLAMAGDTDSRTGKSWG